MISDEIYMPERRFLIYNIEIMFVIAAVTSLAFLIFFCCRIYKKLQSSVQMIQKLVKICLCSMMLNLIFLALFLILSSTHGRSYQWLKQYQHTVMTMINLSSSTINYVFINFLARMKRTQIMIDINNLLISDVLKKIKRLRFMMIAYFVFFMLNFVYKVVAAIFFDLELKWFNRNMAICFGISTAALIFVKTSLKLYLMIHFWIMTEQYIQLIKSQMSFKYNIARGIVAFVSICSIKFYLLKLFISLYYNVINI